MKYIFIIALAMIVATAAKSVNAQTPGNCPLHRFGDANCDCRVDETDKAILMEEYLGTASTVRANFDGISTCRSRNSVSKYVCLADHQIWISNNGKICAGETSQPSPTSTLTPAPIVAVSAVPAFPGAEGFGSATSGGRNGAVLVVTNTNDSGPGSLRAAIDAFGPRIVVFKTGGAITLRSKLIVKNPSITIAAQTAPGDGIYLRNSGLIIATHDVIVRGLRVRVGDDPNGTNPTTRDGITISSSETGQDIYNVIVDHSSVSWGIDENMSTWTTKVHDVTVQWSIVSEALYNSIHIDEGASVTAPHSMGFLIGDSSRNISIHHNLFAHNNDRNPVMNGGTRVEVINNVLYNWGSKFGIKFVSRVYPSSDPDGFMPDSANVIGNYGIPGVNSSTTSKVILIERDLLPYEEGSRIYVKGNIGPGRLQDTGNEFDAVRIESIVNPKPGDQQNANVLISTPAFAGSGISTLSATDAYTQVLDKVGATAPKRDIVDARVINSVRNRTGQRINSQNEVGGFPVFSAGTSAPDTDNDGMPDAWEQSTGVSNPAVADANTITQSGYTAIELYINSFFPAGSL